MNAPDTHWQRRLHSFHTALLQLDEAMELMSQRPLSKLERQGALHEFEYSYELGWNTLKDFLVWQGIEGIIGSRDAIREAFSTGLIADGQGWMHRVGVGRPDAALEDRFVAVFADRQSGAGRAYWAGWQGFIYKGLKSLPAMSVGSISLSQRRVEIKSLLIKRLFFVFSH